MSWIKDKLFNRKIEGESSIVEDVNSAIAEGKINVPARTKLYNHSIIFNYNRSNVGDLLEGGAIPISVISTRQTPYTLEDLNGSIIVNIALGVMSILNEDIVNFNFLVRNKDTNEIQCSNGLVGGSIIYTDVENITDTVTEIQL